jgi:hypothetical protein
MRCRKKVSDALSARTIGWPLYDKSLGDVLYAVAAYLALAKVLYRKPPARVALLALAMCVAVETFQATGIPARYAHPWPARWLLGTTFAWHDMVCYVIRVAAILGVDWVLLRPGWQKRW